MSRALTSLLLMKSGYNYIPYSSLESIVENNKDSYYLNLRGTQTTLKDDEPDWLPWLRFFLNTLKWQKDHLASKTDVVNGYENLAPNSVKIMEYMTIHQHITTKIAVSITQSPRTSVKSRLQSLVTNGFLVRHGK